MRRSSDSSNQGTAVTPCSTGTYTNNSLGVSYRQSISFQASEHDIIYHDACTVLHLTQPTNSFQAKTNRNRSNTLKLLLQPIVMSRFQRIQITHHRLLQAAGTVNKSIITAFPLLWAVFFVFHSSTEFRLVSCKRRG